MVDRTKAAGVAGDPDDIYDPSNFVFQTALNGKTGVIREIFATIHNYNGATEDQTAVRAVVVSPDLDRPRVLLVACGGLKPAIRVDDPTSPKGYRLQEAIAGPNLTGGQIEARSNIADFQKNLVASGFPMERMRNGVGFAALENANFLWKAFTKKINKNEVKGYDVPAQFLGFVEPDPDALTAFNAQAAGASDAPALPSSVTAAGNGGVAPTPASDEELKAQVTQALLEALAVQPEISRAQLSAKVGPKLKDNPRRVEGYAILLKDEFLAQVPGTTYDKKLIRRINAGNAEAVAS